MADRRVVVHTDDVGMCHGANTAFVELSKLGAVTAGSLMVPCPWAAEMAELAAGDPQLDLGVHLTLTSEKAHYRWRPLTPAPASSGMTDDAGFQWRSVADVRRHAEPEAVEAEMRAQVDWALARGVDVTHLDAHMGAALAPEFLDAYIRMGIDYAVPVLLTPTIGDYGPRKHLAGADDARFEELIAQAATQGFAIFETVGETDFDRTGPAEPYYRGLIESLPEGLSFLAFHPNAPGELDAIEPESAYIRTDEYELFAGEDHRRWLAEQDLEPIGFRGLRDDLRATLGRS